VVPFGLQGSSSLLMRAMKHALMVGLDYPGDSIDNSSRPGVPGPTVGPRTVHAGVPGSSGPLGRCAQVYMDDCLVHSPMLAQHLLDVEEVLEMIFRRRQLYTKSRHRLAARGGGRPTSSWWITTPSSPARCSVPLSRARARASSSARRTTRTPTPR
jgi:hypothetical protein